MDKQILKNCNQCGKEMLLQPSRAKKRKYCSRSCAIKYFHKQGLISHNINSGCFKKGFTPWIKGRNTSSEAKEKQSRAKLINPVRYWLGKERPEQRKPDIEKSNWRKYRQQLMDRTEYKEWRRKVFERDNYTCVNCDSKNGQGKSITLEAHHIKRAKDYPELIMSVDNGITVCDICHDLLDTIKMTDDEIERALKFGVQNLLVAVNQ